MIPSHLLEQIRQVVPTLQGWCTVPKALEIARCILKHRPSVCVEIGVFGGRSLLPQAMVCRHLNHGHVYGIDPWSTQEAIEGLVTAEEISFWGQVDLESIYRGCLQAVLDHSLTRYCTLIRQRSHHCSELFSRIGFLHIDGQHDRDRSVRDVELFLPRVVPGGHVWMDDADWESTQDAIRMLQDECEVIQHYGNVIHFRKHEVQKSPPRNSYYTPSVSIRRTQWKGRTLLICSDDDRLGEYCGGIYNPGCAVHQGRILLLARNERYSEFQRRAHPPLLRNSVRPMAILLNSQLEPELLFPLEMSPELKAGRAEDYRLFQYRNQLFAGFSNVLAEGRIEYQVSKVDLSERRLLSPLRPRLDVPLMPLEKNWCFFENAGSLCLLYSFQPYRLLRIADEDTFRFETIRFVSLDVKEDSHSLRNGAILSLSAGPVEFSGDQLLFIHCRDQQRNYQHYAVVVDSVTLLPKRISRKPLFRGGNAIGMHPNVLYLMSVLRRDGSCLFFFGEGDQHISFAELPDSEVVAALADSVELETTPLFQPVIAGDYEYEHTGLFRRRVSLHSDASIRNGGEHDSMWRLELVDGETVLIILGTDGISSRMRMTGNGRWCGTWNHGHRPQASLTQLPANGTDSDMADDPD